MDVVKKFEPTERRTKGITTKESGMDMALKSTCMVMNIMANGVKASVMARATTSVMDSTTRENGQVVIDVGKASAFFGMEMCTMASLRQISCTVRAQSS